MSDMQNSPRSRIGIASTSISILMFLLGLTLGNVSVGRSLLKLDEQHISRNHAVQHNISDAEGTANKKIESRDQTSTKAVVEKVPSIKGAVENIILIGERHSGTNWITDYLTECFQGDQIKVTNEFSDWKLSHAYKALSQSEKKKCTWGGCMSPKHLFQEENLIKVPENSAVVVAMFRDPYMWVEAMRILPYHAHSHVDLPQFLAKEQKKWQPLGWKEFVSKPWIGKMDLGNKQGLATNFYELQHDGSGRAYSSIIDLRRDKIINHLSVSNFVGTRAFLPMRYEDLYANGTSALLRSIEEASGLKANCSAIIGKGNRQLRTIPITNHTSLSGEFIDWMNEFVDWEVESRIGYYRRVAQSS